MPSMDEGLARLLRQAAAIKDAQRRIANSEEARASRALVAANVIAARLQWHPIKAVALIEDQTCQTCGCVHQLFRGFAVLMQRKADKTIRLVTAKGLDQGLPRGRYFIQTHSEACLECLPEQGI